MVMIWTNRRTFHGERIILPPAPFLSFLPLSLNNIRMLFPSRCRAMGGEEGMRFCCPYLTSVYVAHKKIQSDGVRHEAGCLGVAMEGCLAPWPRPHHVAGARGRPGGEGVLWGEDDALVLPPCWAGLVMTPCPVQWEEDDPFCWKVFSGLWILAGFHESVFSWNFKHKVLPSDGSIFENLSCLSGKAWLGTFLISVLYLDFMGSQKVWDGKGPLEVV